MGKTTICLGLISACKKSIAKLGFMKPVGQHHEKVDGCLLVDKDVVLFKEHFELPLRYESMSPVILPPGFTRDFLNGKVTQQVLQEKIRRGFDEIAGQSDFTIVEGTGHLGVGSVVNLNNAQVASLLGLDIILIVKGGVGSSFDELALNKALCDALGVRVKGVILNRVLNEKREMVIDYMQKALLRWNIPLIGCIPYHPFLSAPSMDDFETLFHTTLISGEQFHYRHFESMRLVATSVETFKENILLNQLIVTPATREDIVDALLEKSVIRSNIPSHGLILTGRYPPSPTLIERLKRAHIPALYANETSFHAMQMITSFIAKIRKEDITKVESAIRLVESHLDCSQIRLLA